VTFTQISSLVVACVVAAACETPVATTRVASVSVTPGWASLPVAGTVQLIAVAKDGSGNTLPDAPLTWSSSDSLTASVTSAGVVTALAVGWATITATSDGRSGAVAVTVTGSCLSQSGPTTTLSGTQSSAYYRDNLADRANIDATSAQFLLAPSEDIAAHVAGGSRICWSGGAVIGGFPPNTPWSTMHSKYGMVAGVTGFASAPLLKVEGLIVFDYGDGISMDDQGDIRWSIRNMHVKYSHDDCVENDFMNGGLIDSSFFDGCFDGMSSQEYRSVLDGSDNVVTIQNSLWRLQAMDAPYDGPIPNHDAFWKWSSLAPKLALYNNVFRADEGSWAGTNARMYMAPPPGKLADCENNVMVWLGSGSFPETLPTTFNGKTCFSLMTGAAGLQYWDNAVAQWKANHPATLPDVGPPIVSLFSPGLVGSTTLTGSVSLTATAVDDRDVAGVQFQMNGQNIGTEVTTESPMTKFTLSWDSRGLPNGTYTLTATARDAAGNTTTSTGITVTISN